MSTAAPLQTAAARPKPVGGPAHAGLLLRRNCACGSTAASLTGECSECKSRKGLRAGSNAHQIIASPGSPLGPAVPQDMVQQFRLDFSRVRVHSDAEAVAATHQLSPGEQGAEEYSGEGVLMTLDGSGTCVNGGAASACDPAIGAYRIQRNDNTCCTKGCSLNHEITHVSDITRWGCCKALSVAYNAPGANKNAAVQKYNDWLRTAVNITECHAYSNDVSCADQMLKAQDCAGVGKDTDCCKDIADYKTRYQAFASSTCAAAPKDAPACPAF